MREARRRRGGCDLQVAKSGSVRIACFIQHGAAERGEQPGVDGSVPAGGVQTGDKLQGKCDL